MKTERNSEITETETKKIVLSLQYEHITLCSYSDPGATKGDYNHEKKHANDQTVIFSDENQMDLTASHTVMITKGLSNCTKSDNSTKIDTTSFLENLKNHAEESRIKKKLECPKISISQNTFPEKINSDNFIKRLKAGKYSTSLDKENSEIPIYSKESNNVSSTHQTHVSLNVDENSSNRTRIFSEQDDGMDLTQCHTAFIQTSIPSSGQDNLGGFKHDTVIYGNECMELTANYTTWRLPSENNLSETETKTQNVTMNFTTVDKTKDSEKKTVLKDKLNAAFQVSFLNPENKIHATKSHNMEPETHTVSQTNQGASTFDKTSKSLCSSPTIQGYKTIFYSSSNDAMELTKCLSSTKERKSLLKPDGNYSNVCASPVAGPLIEKTTYSEEDNMEITKSHTIVIDKEMFTQGQENIKKEITAIPVFEKEMILQNHITTSEDEKMNVNYITVPQVFKEGLQESLTNRLSDRRIELLAGEDMDLPESYTSKLKSQVIPTTFDLASKNFTESYSQSKNPSDDRGKVTKSLSQPFQKASIILKNILTDLESKEKHPILKISSCLGKKSPLSVDYNQDMARNHNISSSGTVLDEQVTVGHTIQDQNSKLLESQRKNLDDPTPDCSHKMIISSEEEQTMDLTKSHTIVIGFGPSEIKEQSKANLEHRNNQLTTVNRQIDVSIPIEKTIVTTNEMDMLKDRSIQKPEFLKEKQNVEICERKTTHGLQIDKTILFSEGNENDMDVTTSYTVKINHRSLLDKHDSPLPMAGTSKTILYTCGQDEMEITRSHTTALECKIISPDEITPSHPDNAVMSIEGHEELEITKSHTVFIDYQAEANSVLPDRLDFELSKKKCLQKPKGMSTPAEETVSISKNSKSNHLASKGSQLTIPEEGSNSEPREDTSDDSETSKLATWKNAKDIQKPGFLNELLPKKTQRRKSLRLQNKTFPENAKNNRDTTQSSVVEISNKINLEDGEDFSFVPLTGTFKPVLSAHMREDMEVARNQTTALENKTDPADEITTIPMDNTVMFLDNYGDLDVTKSHTVFIDCQVKEKVLHEYTKLGMVRTENFSGPESDTCIQEASNSIVASNVSCFSSVKPSLSNLNGKTEDVLDFQTAHILPPAEQSLEVEKQTHNNMSIAPTTEMYNLGYSDGRDEESENHTGAETTSLPLKAIVKDKTRRCSLGIFLPKFPNKKNCSITVVDDLEQIPADGTDVNHLETQLVSSKDSDIGAVAAKLNLSPSQYINEENLPVYPDEIFSSDSISIDTEEKALIDTYYKEILPSECKIEVCNAPKRTWVQEDDNVISEKKIRTHDSTQNQEKLKNGQITIKEFFILLQVHILIQKPRQSRLPVKFAINSSPTPEDLMLRQYVSALTQDKLLTDVNRNLWEKMKDCSNEELKTYGIYLNKIKSRYTKMTKVFTHQGKVALYNKLVHSAENEEKDDPMDEWDSEMKYAEKELEQLKTEEEELQRKLLEVETHKTQTLAQIEFIKEQTKKTEELLDQPSLSEWDVIEWIGLPFLDKPYRKIDELNFQSMLDEHKAPPSSLLVHKLIFQYIEEQESWKKKCTTQHQVPQMLQELSLVVNHCRLLGEEIEFLKRWGPNYSLMDINVNNTELRLLFSSIAAFAKFEITLSLSAQYPFVPPPFAIQNHLGNTSHDEIATIISKVPLEDNYLKNVVKQIYQHLLKD
ncbi:hypothetical protein U0070_010432 [Myodes glareolus]|uniref:Knl1 C-terminal RWD domain-containing protein n=1 Tax=Myodes glareolus TaxID=447135 RepID=A0AAW0I878_MYOGA